MTAIIGAADLHADSVRRLFEESDAHAAGLYAPEDNHPITPGTLRRLGGVFLTATMDGAVVGGGAMVPRDGYAEIKRMFVREAARGAGIGRALLSALEREAAARGFGHIRLETGVKQPEALALYRSGGYRPRAPYGGMPASPASVFFEKKL